MWMTNDDPPTAVVSVTFGSMPRYSPSSSVEIPAVNRPSTSFFVSPASASAERAASACSMIAGLSGTRPIWSDSATPTMAVFPEILSTLAPSA